MTRVSSLAAAFGVALALGACAGEGGQLATSPEAPAFQTGGVGPACNLTDLRKATSALFGNKHPANDIAKQFTSKNQNKPAATALAYDLFKLIEAKRADSWASGDPAKGAELTLQIIACADVVYTDTDLSGALNYEAARDVLELALDLAGTGAYAVRGGAADEAAVVSKNEQKGLGAPGDFATWFGGARSLIIGYSISPVDFSNEEETGLYYDWSMVRPAGSNTLNGLATISYCVDDGVIELVDELRIQHLQGNDGTILRKGNDVAGVHCVAGVPLGVQPAGFGSFVAEP